MRTAVLLVVVGLMVAQSCIAVSACAGDSSFLQRVRALAPAEVLLDGAFPTPVTRVVRAAPLAFALAGDVCTVPADADVHVVQTRDVGDAASAVVLRWPPEEACTPLAIVNLDEPNGLARCSCGGILLPANGRFGLVVGAAPGQGASDVEVTFLGDGIPAATLRPDHPVPRNVSERLLAFHFIGSAAPSALAGARARIAGAPASLFLYLDRTLAFPELLPADGRMQPDAKLDRDEPVLLQTYSPYSCTVLGMDGQLFTVPTDALREVAGPRLAFPPRSRRCDDVGALMLDAALRDGTSLSSREPSSDVGRAYRGYLQAANAFQAFTKPIATDRTADQHTDAYMVRSEQFAPELPLHERVLCRELDMLGAPVLADRSLGPEATRTAAVMRDAARALATALRDDRDDAQRRDAAVLCARLLSAARNAPLAAP